MDFTSLYSTKIQTSFDDDQNGNIDLDVNAQQAVAIASDHYTLIRSNLFPDPIVAHIQYVNIKKHMVSLNKLCFVEVLAEKRASVRVNPDPPIRATIHHDNQKIPSELVDISTQGIALIVETYLSIEPGTEMSVMFMLPDPVLLTHTMIKLPVTLVGVSGDASPYRYKFRISPEKHQEQLISRYSFQRQVEIIRDLKGSADL